MQKSELLKIIASMKKADERLYFPDGDEAAFWRKVRESPMYGDEIAELRAAGQAHRDTPIPELTYSLFTSFAKTGSRLEYERVYFQRRQILNTAVLLSLLEPEQEEHLKLVCEILWSVCGEYTWCLPAHLSETGLMETIDLFSAETGFALSEIRCLLGDRLPSLLQGRVKDEVYMRLLAPYLTSGPYHWEIVAQHGSAVCAGSIGAAALLLVKDKETLTDILMKVESGLERYLQGFGDDGACLVGLDYWNDDFSYFVYYADLLRRRSRGMLDWFQLKKVSSMAKLQQECMLGGKSTAHFSGPQQTGDVFLGLSHYLATEYPDLEAPAVLSTTRYTNDHFSYWAPALRNLVWRRAEEELQEWATLSQYLPDVQHLL
ncbi:hypothetical protein PAECIP111892_01686 [Paenibacillus auburnensis]|uniref:Uncharacterized protein n=1 Tax=Paenibacillus auburnensis TaxID=2905649 RepID=A0ABN8FY76_9BACL|nr:hypothetical protein [Paenibacillus auburnensis]CAH1194503.1 hypothetical protein PAECIP111892_01686 [Paenibacillus auburnensis]